MKAERWWPHAVLCGVEPDSLAGQGTPESGSTLHRLIARLDDLQTLGVDAVLLHHLEPDTQLPPPDAPGQEGAAGAVLPIDPRYGTIDEVDDLVREAARHGLRVLVELRRGVRGTTLTDDARFWLNHGVTGVSLGDDDPQNVRTLRIVLRGYVGERVLIAQRSAPPTTLPNQETAVSSSTSNRPEASGPPRHPSEPPAYLSDLLRVSLPSIDEGAAGIRVALESTTAPVGTRTPAPLLSAAAMSTNPAAYRSLASILLGSGGAVLLRVDDLDLAHASDPAAAGSSSASSLFAWCRLWSGLHRGNAIMRSGNDRLLNHDAEGALVWIRQSIPGAPPIVVIANVTSKPVRLSLVSDISDLHLRGSFLRTLARSDGGMGAMPLRQVVLPPFAVYAGELSR